MTKKFWPSDLEWRTPKMRSDLPSTSATVPVNGLALVKLEESDEELTHEEAASAIRSPAKALQGLMRFLVRTPLIPKWIFGKLAGGADEMDEFSWSYALATRPSMFSGDPSKPWPTTVLMESALCLVGIPLVALWRCYKSSEEIRDWLTDKAQKVADVVFGKEPL